MTNDMPKSLQGSETCLNEFREVLAIEHHSAIVNPTCSYTACTLGVLDVRPGDTVVMKGDFCVGVKRKPPIKYPKSKRWGKRKKPLHLM